MDPGFLASKNGYDYHSISSITLQKFHCGVCGRQETLTFDPFIKKLAVAQVVAIAT
jgi:hypothetical protein